MNFGLIICPVWKIGLYHPHQERVEQWINSFENNNIIPILVSLSDREQLVNIRTGKGYLGLHPRITNLEVFLKEEKSLKIQNNIKRRLNQLLSKVVRKYRFSVIVISHPYLIDVFNHSTFHNNLIIDFPNAPKNLSDLYKWGFKNYQDFEIKTFNSFFVIYHKKESCFLLKNEVDPRKIKVIPPLINNLIQPKTIQPKHIVFHGRASVSNFKIIKSIIKEQLKNDFLINNNLSVIICGEVSAYFNSHKNVKVIGPVLELYKYIKNNICPVIVPENFSGISYRVKDIVSSGGILIANRRAALGYPMGNYPFILDDINELGKILKHIMNNTRQAYTKLFFLQKQFKNLNRITNLECNSLMSDILKNENS